MKLTTLMLLGLLLTTAWLTATPGGEILPRWQQVMNRPAVTVAPSEPPVIVTAGAVAAHAADASARLVPQDLDAGLPHPVGETLGIDPLADADLLTAER
jgi:hypothetical protein